MSWNANLQGEPLEIASSNSKRIRVMAGPGTGKSFAMKRRIMRFIEGGISPQKILAVTFTRTAAHDLKKELKDGITGAETLSAMTLHAFCYGLLNKKEIFNHLQRVPRPLKTFTLKGSPQFELSPLLYDLDLIDTFGSKREKFKIIKAFEAAWSRNQDQELWLKTDLDKKFHRAIEQWLKRHHSMLIGELVPLALLYLQNNPASDIFEKYTHIIVDEYQDLNKAEQTIIDLLGKNCSISIVGDIDQSIYSFRYAHPSGIEDFFSRHENVEDRTLNQCRRCDQHIVSIANSLICHNHEKNTKRLNYDSQKERGEVRVVQWKTADDEAKGIAQLIKTLTDSSRYNPSDILILSPGRLLGYKLRDLIQELNIPIHSFFHEEAVESKDAQKAITLLNLLVYPEDDVSLRFWLGMGSSNWHASQYKVVMDIAIEEGKNVKTLLDECINGREIKNINALKRSYGLLLSEIQSLSSLTILAVIDYLFPEGQDGTKILRDSSLLFIENKPDSSIEDLYEHLETLITQPEMPENGEYVRIMSLHKSKGLTSKVVIITSCIQGLIPILDHNEESLREQRRLFYVALTRAKEFLVLSSFTKMPKELAYSTGKKVSRKGRSAETNSSVFISELGADCPSTILGEQWQTNGFI